MLQRCLHAHVNRTYRKLQQLRRPTLAVRHQKRLLISGDLPVLEDRSGSSRNEAIASPRVTNGGDVGVHSMRSIQRAFMRLQAIIIINITKLNCNLHRSLAVSLRQYSTVV